MQITIKTLYEQGYNKSQIARILNIDRKTVRKVIGSQESGYGEMPRKEYASQISTLKSLILLFDFVYCRTSRRCGTVPLTIEY